MKSPALLLLITLLAAIAATSNAVKQYKFLTNRATTRNVNLVRGHRINTARALSTKSPSGSTRAPSGSTRAPSVSTKAPSVSTKAPSVSTKAPSVGGDSKPTEPVPDNDDDGPAVTGPVQSGATASSMYTLTASLSTAVAVLWFIY
eukprot:CAMPEP_0203644494 /NCGR_PEP_ID=MMETSP0088-20131115/9919_1 /ASSEMBLY_ACC=CAM_ASM_001087 /TAXON_ID=426623 /ORGANISM="Chaetoceros affinis, Strain CCMP159" /LENGTH=145 /DNA_ID=CAMNT_0050501027 /DNA_START=14 /DNA_END=451 /DNA_ORIENTATION=-